MDDEQPQPGNGLLDKAWAIAGLLAAAALAWMALDLLLPHKQPEAVDGDGGNGWIPGEHRWAQQSVCGVWLAVLRGLHKSNVHVLLRRGNRRCNHLTYPIARWQQDCVY